VKSQFTTDLVIVGNGIVGAATALRIKQDYPDLAVLLVDKEVACATHQTGHNSGVVHAGVYYQPGSLKADFCKRGAALTRSFCQEYDLPYDQCGKLLVATNDLELERMTALAERCRENGITFESLSGQELRAREQRVSGLGALFVPATAITDFPKITETMIAQFRELGGKTLFGAEIVRIEENEKSVKLEAGSHLVEAASLIACAGLMSDRLVRMMNVACDFRIVPFRGEYYRLADALNEIVKHLIYPIPDPELPFLGVHLTPMVDGTITVGPNAVLGWKREGYGQLNFSFRDVAEMLAFPGFWKVVGNNFGIALKEMADSFYLPGYLQRVRKYCPDISATDLKPYPAGIRAQAVLADGTIVHDFLFRETARTLHVCNAPSPAATSAMPIAEYLAEKAAAQFRL